MQVELRSRTFGELLGLTLSVTFAHFAKLFAIALVFSLPLFAYTWLVPTFGASEAEPSEAAVYGFLAVVLLNLLLLPLQQAASILIVAGSFTDRTPGLGECFAVALRRFLPLVALSIVTGILIGLPLIAVGVVFAIAAGVADAMTAACVLPLLAVAGFAVSANLLAVYYCAPAALIVEGASVGGAMGRSARLGTGGRWRIFWFWAVTTLLLAVVSNGAELGIEAVVPADTNLFANVSLGWGIGSVFRLLALVAPVVYYFDLRVTKEAYDLESVGALVDAIGRRAADR